MEKHKLVYKYFDDDDFLSITNKITELELKTSGEIRVLFKENRPFLSKSKSIAQIAHDEFFRLKMNETRDKTGILLFFLLEERSFYICADSGINSLVAQDTWDKIRDKIQLSFKNGDFLHGVISGLDDIGAILSKHFPRKFDDTDELSNAVEF